MYKINDKVFAKRRGYPAWPAIISSVNADIPSKIKYNVYLYSIGKCIECNSEELFPYEENKSKLGNPRTKLNILRSFADALDKIESDAGNLVLAENNAHHEYSFMTSSKKNNLDEKSFLNFSENIDQIEKISKSNSERKEKFMINESSLSKKERTVSTSSHSSFIKGQKRKLSVYKLENDDKVLKSPYNIRHKLLFEEPKIIEKINSKSENISSTSELSLPRNRKIVATKKGRQSLPKDINRESTVKSDNETNVLKSSSSKQYKLFNESEHIGEMEQLSKINSGSEKLRSIESDLIEGKNIVVPKQSLRLSLVKEKKRKQTSVKFENNSQVLASPGKVQQVVLLDKSKGVGEIEKSNEINLEIEGNNKIISESNLSSSEKAISQKKKVLHSIFKGRKSKNMNIKPINDSQVLESPEQLQVSLLNESKGVSEIENTSEINLVIEGNSTINGKKIIVSKKQTPNFVSKGRKKNIMNVKSVNDGKVLVPPGKVQQELPLDKSKNVGEIKVNSEINSEIVNNSTTIGKKVIVSKKQTPNSVYKGSKRNIMNVKSVNNGQVLVPPGEVKQELTLDESKNVGEIEVNSEMNPEIIKNLTTIGKKVIVSKKHTPNSVSKGRKTKIKNVKSVNDGQVLVPPGHVQQELSLDVSEDGEIEINSGTEGKSAISNSKLSDVKKNIISKKQAPHTVSKGKKIKTVDLKSVNDTQVSPGVVQQELSMDESKSVDGMEVKSTISEFSLSNEEKNITSKTKVPHFFFKGRKGGKRKIINVKSESPIELLSSNPKRLKQHKFITAEPIVLMEKLDDNLLKGATNIQQKNKSAAENNDSVEQIPEAAGNYYSKTKQNVNDFKDISLSCNNAIKSMSKIKDSPISCNKMSSINNSNTGNVSPSKDSSSCSKTRCIRKSHSLASTLNESAPEEKFEANDEDNILPITLNYGYGDSTYLQIGSKNIDSNRVELLQTEVNLLDYIYKLRSALRTDYADCEMALDVLNRMSALKISALMLKKHRKIVDTIIKVTNYSGNVREWNVSEEEVIEHSKKARIIRCSAQKLLNKFMSLFTVPYGQTFQEVYNKEVNDFFFRTKHMACEQIYGSTSDKL